MTAPTKSIPVAIGSQTAKSAAWLASAKLFSRGLSLVRMLILATILPLDQLGLFGISVIVMQFLTRISETGMTQALIQKKGEVADYLGTAWLTQITRGLMLSVMLLCSATLLEGFFEKEGVARLLTVMAVIPVLQGIQNVGLIYLHRELRFKKIVLIEMITSPLELLVSIGIVWFYQDAMALVIARITNSAVTVVLGYFIEKRRAQINFSMPKFQELYGFGFWIFASSILSFTLVRGSDIIIGKYLTADKLAIYQIAYGLACVPLMEIIKVVGKPTFSAYSRLQDDHPRFCHAFLRVYALICFIAAFSIAGFFCLSFDFVSVFMKAELLPIAVMLPWLSVWAACRSLGATNSVVLQAAGKPAYATIFQIFMLILFASVLLPMTIRYGSFGAIYSLVGIGISAQLFRYSILSFVLKIPLQQIVVSIFVPMSLALTASLITTSTMNIFCSDPGIVRLIIGLVTLTLTYGVMALFSERWLGFGLSKFATHQIPILKRLSFFNR